jgi:hypothetical protein
MHGKSRAWDGKKETQERYGGERGNEERWERAGMRSRDEAGPVNLACEEIAMAAGEMTWVGRGGG